jgi:thiamine-phosphate pyrophosphorylase
MNEPLPPQPQIYLISPVLADTDRFSATVGQILAAATVACVLLDIDARDPAEAKRRLRALAPLVQDRGAAALARDPTLAVKAGADGAHMRIDRPEDLHSLEAAVGSLKPDRIVGAGGSLTRHEAMAAGEQGVDYVLFGETPAGAPPWDLTELVDTVVWWSEIFTPPCVALCAELDHAPALIRAGADFLAFGDALWREADPAAALRAALPAALSRGTVA